MRMVCNMSRIYGCLFASWLGWTLCLQFDALNSTPKSRCSTLKNYNTEFEFIIHQKVAMFVCGEFFKYNDVTLVSVLPTVSEESNRVQKFILWFQMGYSASRKNFILELKEEAIASKVILETKNRDLVFILLNKNRTAVFETYSFVRLINISWNKMNGRID